MNVRSAIDGFFGGTSVEEIASTFSVSETYIEDLIRAWRAGAEWAQKVEEEKD